MGKTDRKNRAMTCPECKKRLFEVEKRGYGKTYICEDCGIIIIKAKKIGEIR